MQLSEVAIVVPDYDEAITFFTNALGFTLIEDTRLSPVKRWVRVAPTHSATTAILLAKADGPTQAASIGMQTGGRVGFFLETADIATKRASMIAAGVHFEEETRCESYGKVAVFQDPWGNRWDLIERS